MKSDHISDAESSDGRGGAPVPHAEAMAELQRVLESPDFETSQRNRAFLKLAVESTLQGHRITGYDVAVRAFNRPHNFNASKDPIVRIECSKLRRALETYYLKSGRRNPLRLDIPKGRYSVVFRPNGRDEGTSATHAFCIDAKSAPLLRAAIAGWAEEGVDAARAWRDLEKGFPGFPMRPSAADLLQPILRLDHGLHGLLTEGLRRLAQRDFFTVKTAGAVL